MDRGGDRKSSKSYFLMTNFSGCLQPMEYEYPPGILDMSCAKASNFSNLNTLTEYPACDSMKQENLVKKLVPKTKRFSMFQVGVMLAEFQTRRGMISIRECEGIGLKLGLEAKQIKKWFMNRKYRMKTAVALNL